MDTWKVGPVELKSRLILGSGKYKDFGVMREAIAAAKAEVVIIGGGIMGLALAYQLAKQGQQRVVVLDEEEVDHEADHFARGEVFARRRIGGFGKLADQLLEHQTHLGVAHHLGVQVDLGELLGDEVKKISLLKAFDLPVKLEALEDLSHRWGERLDVAAQVFADVVLIAHQPLHVER